MEVDYNTMGKLDRLKRICSTHTCQPFVVSMVQVHVGVCTNKSMPCFVHMLDGFILSVAKISYYMLLTLFS